MTASAAHRSPDEEGNQGRQSGAGHKEATLTITSKWEAAEILRAEAESIRHHGFTNFFSHQFNCLLSQVLRPETCEGCLLGDYVPEEFRKEAFPCQHFDEAALQRIAAVPGLPEKVADRFVSIAEELEALARADEASAGKPAPR